MRRVLHILNSLERSGMETMLLCSAAEWARSGYSCDVLASAASIGPLAPQMRAAGYGVFHIPFRSRYRYLPRIRFIADFYRLCGSGYDVVHIHTETATPILAILAKLAGVSYIALTPHNTFYFSGLLRARKVLERFLIRLLGGRYGMISNGVRRCEWENFGNPGVRTWNWLDTSRFRPPTPDERASARQSLGCWPDQFVVVSVGNCNDVKNHPEILRGLSLLPSSIVPYYLHVGREEANQPERALAAKLQIEDKVCFCGSQEDTREFLWAADVYVMPSLREGLSIAAIEAIAAGVPAVLANIGGLADVAAETGFTVLISTTAESIADGIGQIATIPAEERRRRAHLDSERIRERFSIRNGVQSLTDGLYRAAPAAMPVRSVGTVR